MGGSGFGLQMSWQPSLLSSKRKTGPPLGLKNLGNTCYLNSVLQCLTYTPPLANFCLRSQHSSLCDSDRDCPFCILEKRIVRSLRLDLPLDAPIKLQSCLRIFADHFRSGRQEDAHEFLRYVIDACHNTCLRLKKLRRKTNSCADATGVTVVQDIFGGALQSQVKCLSCHSESNKVDEIMDISLDVLHSTSLKDAMHKFFRPEILDGNNKYKCENCKKLVAARKQMSIFQAPNVLVIQLKRFEGMLGGKIDKPIPFEEILLLSGFMCKSSQDSQPEYNLFGTIVHSGCSPESGHYYAYIKDAIGHWYCCNDSYVTLSTLQDVLSEKVYILFFSRTNRENSTTFVSRGGESCFSNGNEGFESPKSAGLSKVMGAKPYGQSSRSDMPAISKVDKEPSRLRVKLDTIFSNSGSKRVFPTVGGKVGTHKSHMEMNGDVKEPSYMENFEKDSANKDGFDNYEKACSTNDKSCKTTAVVKAYGHVQNGTANSMKPHRYGCHDSTNWEMMEKSNDRHKYHNGGLNFNSDIQRSKRMLEDDSCVLLAQDAQSQARVEEMKDVLKHEAFSLLRSCGWTDKVYNFMCSRKRLRTGVQTVHSVKELKNLLIADAKPTFISQVPESLKEDLIKHIRSFSQEK